MYNSKVLSMVLFVFIFLLSFAYSAGPGTITYQGTITDSSHNPPGDGIYAMRFTLFDMESGGSQKWQETHSAGNSILIANGCFSAELGKFTSFPSALFQDNQNLWLEVEADLDNNGFQSSEKYAPRVRFTSTPYAFVSDRATTASFTLQSLDAKKVSRDFIVDSGETINNGDVVQFMEGYIRKFNDPQFSSGSLFDSFATYFYSISALTDSTFVVAYQESDIILNGKVIVGMVSGDTISWGTPSFFHAANTWFISVAALSDTKIVVVYNDEDNSNYGTAVIGTVSGGSISWGSEYVFSSTATVEISVAALSDTSFVVCYDGNSSYGTAIVGTVSGSSISWGSEYVFNTAFSICNSASALSSSKFVVAYEDTGNSDYGTARIGTVSGTTISWGLEYVFNPGTTYAVSSTVLSDASIIVSYRDEGNSGYGTAIAGSISGTVISWGSEYVFNPAATNAISTTAFPDSSFVVVYSDGGNSFYNTAVIGKVTGTMINLSSELVFNAATSSQNAACTLTDSGFVVAQKSSGGKAFLGFRYLMTLGVANADASGGQTVPVTVYGFSDSHSGLTVGAAYYVDSSGSLTSTPTNNKIGIAVSPSEILLLINR